MSSMQLWFFILLLNDQLVQTLNSIHAKYYYFVINWNILTTYYVVTRNKSLVLNILYILYSKCFACIPIKVLFSLHIKNR